MSLLLSVVFFLFIHGSNALFPDCANGPELLTSNAVCNPSLSVQERATAIINAMTLEEKLNNTGSSSPGVPRLGLPAYTWYVSAHFLRTAMLIWIFQVE